MLAIALMGVTGNSSSNNRVGGVVDFDVDLIWLYEYERVDLLANLDWEALK